jgi:hypothetical protein
LTDRYAAQGVTFSGPAPGNGGAILNECAGFTISGQSSPNFLAFNTSTYATPPETITFASPAHSVSIRAGQGSGGTVTVTAFDDSTPVAESFRTSTPALATLSVVAARITSVRLAFTGTGVVFDDLVWGTAPVSPDDAYATKENAPLAVAGPGVLANDTDAEGDPLTAVLSRPPGNGTVVLDPSGSFTYTPAPGFAGTDSFGYRANDGTGNGNEATVTVRVDKLPPPPPPPPPPTLIPTTVGNNWAAARTYTTVISLSAKRLPAGASVVVKCKTRKKSQQKSRCPYKSKSFKAPAGKAQVNLAKLFRKKKLPIGTKITITITAPTFIGKVFTYTIRSRAIPRLKLQCLAPGSTKAGSCPA